MGKILENYLCLSVADLKRAGYFVPDAAASGVVSWSSGGERIAAVGLVTDTRTLPVVRLSYSIGDDDIVQMIYLRWKRSNLSPDSNDGYYYFVCPVTGVLCRKLYLVGRSFVGRRAFRSVYKTQTKSHSQRDNPLYRYFDLIQAVDRLTEMPNRRERYKGKLTPYGRKLERITREIERCTRICEIGV